MASHGADAQTLTGRKGHAAQLIQCPERNDNVGGDHALAHGKQKGGATTEHAGIVIMIAQHGDGIGEGLRLEKFKRQHERPPFAPLVRPEFFQG